MSETYNYANGAVHHDHRRSITINGASGRDLQALVKAFMCDEAQEAVCHDEAVCHEMPTPTHEALPEVLLTDKARDLHARLMEAGMVDEAWMPVGLSFTERSRLSTMWPSGSTSAPSGSFSAHCGTSTPRPCARRRREDWIRTRHGRSAHGSTNSKKKLRTTLSVYGARIIYV